MDNRTRPGVFPCAEPHDTTTPRHHDTTTPRHHDTTTRLFILN
ncbi:hypothetical protein EDWATA_02404 [Edwardsiella tarda ATCC 23685]|uniref:Uncharacterized protein n=1 Tax=Edwardsiella tarda ATCC 23685 TaxID=500638 RepID=D4F6M3_EDWTA|nr:hypothetical protein EDWATA_02404 [Edwardsiella tarda ATCC 23685]